MRKYVLICILFFLFAATAFAQQYKIKLLALQENSETRTGKVVDLLLEAKPGRGKIFLETLPLVQVTTQASLRFATHIACKEFNLNCSDSDFFFTILAPPGIVSGPSAGAAIAALVVALKLNLSLTDNLAITGTISPGGIVGNVGGVKEKVEAAAKAGITKVLIPKGSPKIEVNDVEIVEVGTLDEVVFHLTNYSRALENVTLEIPEKYKNKMREVAHRLCDFNATLEEAKNFTRLGIESLEKGKFYASSSFCFRARVLEKQSEYEKLTADVQETKLKKLEDDLEIFLKDLEKKEIKTISDLQVFMLVKERALETKEEIEKIKKEVDLKKRNEELAYAEERFTSAKIWSEFFNGKDKTWRVTQEKIKSSCESKIAEAEEAESYIRTLIPIFESDTERAKKLAEEGDYIMCLFEAAKTKARENLILTASGIEEARFKEIVDLKLQAIAKETGKALKQNIFPIISLFYKEYVESLKDIDTVAALQFAELALELAALDIYFDTGVAIAPPVETIKPETPKPKIEFPKLKIEFKKYLPYAIFILGALILMTIGILIGYAIGKGAKKIKSKKEKKLKILKI